MKRYVLVVLAVMAVFLGLFGIAEALNLPLLTDPGPWLSRGGWAAAALGFVLLVADVVLPVPSSLVMIAHGALFGVLGGTLLSLAGSLGAGLFGFLLGRRGSGLVARLVSEPERGRADALLARWGDLAVVVTRPVPILAETVALLAGASPMGWTRMTLATLAGSLPAALLYAITGATARSFDSVVLVLGLVLAVAGLFWGLGALLGRRHRDAAGRYGLQGRRT